MSKKRKRTSSKKDWRILVWYIFISFFILSIITASLSNNDVPKQNDFSQFLNDLDNGNIKRVEIRTSDQMLQYTTQDNAVYKAYYVHYANLIQELKQNNVDIVVNPTDSGWFWALILQAFLPFLLIGGFWFFMFRSAQGASSQAMSFGKSRVSPWKKEGAAKVVTFRDIAGVDEAVEELREIVDFLKSPDKFKKIGAKIPKGALLMGPPGTGKTLLAKAVAGEADVPFFSLSGSDFVEMFVGVGASRVRDLFAQAKKNAPAIIFVDEIDAVGRHRGAGLGGGHDEREQTLNALLVEMDGFSADTTIIVLAATNRPDILDPALLRPGRFDRQITVDKPDLSGRQSILAIHAAEKQMDPTVDLAVIARRTPGFTGADLANTINEAALLAARRNKDTVSLAEIEESVERIMAGPQRKSRVMSDKEKEIVAYHETGHALVALYTEGTDPVHKVSILPRGMALGYTLQLPQEDRFLISRDQIMAQIKVLLGGRVAEHIIFDEITSGASNDIERVTELAKNYVCKYGMSTTLGARRYGVESGPVFLGRRMNDQSQDYSDQTALVIDTEINQLIQQAYDDVVALLTKHKRALVVVSTKLLEEEVIDGKAFRALVESVASNDVSTNTVSNNTPEKSTPAKKKRTKLPADVAKKSSNKTVKKKTATPTSKSTTANKPDNPS
jgi:cell division protease FtsH